MLRAKDLPKNLSAEAVSKAVYVLNRTVHSNNKAVTTPYEAWTGRKPELERVRIFGSVAYTHVPKMLRRKLDYKLKEMVLVGYQGESSNYRLYDTVTKSVSESRDMVFGKELSGVSQQDEDHDEGVLALPKTGVEDEEIKIEYDDELVVEDPELIQRQRRPEDETV